jgi:predicted ABC-type ATPase
MYLSLNDVSISIDRVAQRVSQGVHDIPEPVIRRRFKAGLELLHSDYKYAVDEWLLFNNSTEDIVLLKEGNNT